MTQSPFSLGRVYSQRPTEFPPWAVVRMKIHLGFSNPQKLVSMHIFKAEQTRLEKSNPFLAFKKLLAGRGGPRL